MIWWPKQMPSIGRLGGIGGADEGAERLHPGQVIVVDTGGRAGDEDALEGGGIGERRAVVNRHGLVLEALAGRVEHPAEHRRVGAERGRSAAGTSPVWMMVIFMAPNGPPRSSGPSAQLGLSFKRVRQPSA